MLIDAYLFVLIYYLTYKSVEVTRPIIEKCIKILKKNKPSPYILKCGKIEFNMKLTPHILICGLSAQGKSFFVESILMNRPDIDIVLLNCFADDMRSLKAKRINTLKDIKSFLETVLDRKYKRPLYVVIDELLALSIADKTIIKTLTKLLAVARHFNVFIIAISQAGQKEEIGNKHLFNSRVCFKMIESSSYQVVLGYAPEDKQLQKREFYYLSDTKGKGIVPIINN